MAEEGEVLRFAGVTLDLGRGTLRNAAGAEVPLAPKPFYLLRTLAREAGRTLSKDALLDAVWPGVHVTEDSLFQAVRDARRAIGDEEGRVLRSVARQGYMLDAAVNAAAPVAEPLTPPEDRPSLVVLPFANMSGEPEQDYFADGMVEEITSALGRIRWFFVIARNSAFTYKGRAVDVRQVGRDLGVRYVLEGSVRKAGGRVRIACQLAEAETGRQLWSERFDAALDDIFELQDRVTEAVAGALESNLQAAEIRRSTAKPTGSLAAYDLYLRALPHFYALTRTDSDAALDLLRRAVETDANFTLAKALAAYCHVYRAAQQWSAPADAARGLGLAREALAGAGDDPATLRLAGHAITYLGRDYEAGLMATGRAVAINPNSAQAANSAGWVHNYAGDPAGAIPLFHRVARLSPLDPEVGVMNVGLAFAHLMAGDLQEAPRYAELAVRQLPSFTTCHRALIVALWRLGREAEARAAVQALLRVEPGTRVGRMSDIWRDRGLRDAYQADLRAAGLPE
ncbi:winged helix-turn-helix domain-containing protein [Falsiroseomonas oryzae]|uniref:winged helix-turn-helix domain-containing protein n=1 Tax=Falsiroseomonas oryzae TaxID=2766473 RepID=UPI0022EA841C|nr:winged helix-turn-helix domain-containing protein [Roseomonas sp. MO-31]